MSKRPAKKHLLHVLILSLVIVLAGGGVALLNQWHQGSTSSYASSDYVVGSPSLPASFVDSIFRQMGSPMVGTGQAVEAASRAYKIDDAFALAVWWTETNDGAAGVGLADHNPGSVRGSIGYPSAYDGYTIYPSYTAAVNYWFMMMQRVYIDRGLTTVSSISHPYVGTSTSDLWAGKVITLMERYRAEAPPFPTPVPTIAPDTARHGKQLAQEQQQEGKGKSTYYPQVVHVIPVTQTQTSSASHGLSGNTRLALVLFDLLLALIIAAWAWSVKRRYARKMQSAPAQNTSQEQMAMSAQAPGIAPASIPGFWQQPAAMQQMSNPWSQQPATAQQQMSNPWELQPAAAQVNQSLWGQSPLFAQQPYANAFNVPQRTTEELTSKLPTTEALTGNSTAQPAYTASASLFTMEAFLTEQPQLAFPNPRTPQPEPNLGIQQDWPANPPTPASERTTDNYEQSVFAPVMNAHSMPSPFHRTRLQGTSEQDQPALLVTGGGLLSRYRDGQSPGEQEKTL